MHAAFFTQNPRVGSFFLLKDLWYSRSGPCSRYLSLVAPARDQTALDADYKYGDGGQARGGIGFYRGFSSKGKKFLSSSMELQSLARIVGVR